MFSSVTSIASRENSPPERQPPTHSLTLTSHLHLLTPPLPLTLKAAQSYHLRTPQEVPGDYRVEVIILQRRCNDCRKTSVNQSLISVTHKEKQTQETTKPRRPLPKHKTCMYHSQRVCCSNYRLFGLEASQSTQLSASSFLEGSKEQETKVQSLSAAYWRRPTTLVWSCTAQQRGFHTATWILKKMKWLK